MSSAPLNTPEYTKLRRRFDAVLSIQLDTNVWSLEQMLAMEDKYIADISPPPTKKRHVGDLDMDEDDCDTDLEGDWGLDDEELDILISDVPDCDNSDFEMLPTVVIPSLSRKLSLSRWKESKLTTRPQLVASDSVKLSCTRP